MKPEYIIGIDEVGRGALAGPVVVAAAALPKNLESEILNFETKLKDSKKLSAKQRERWFAFIRRKKISYAVAVVSPKVIDKINISNAANLAAARAFKKITTRHSLNSKFCRICLDGGLYINSKPNPPSALFGGGGQKSELRFKNQKLVNLKTRTIIKGDEKIPAISLASIVAKVSRDRYMEKLHEKYLRYGFINHVGYGTAEHIAAIKKFGYSKVHRRSFRTAVGEPRPSRFAGEAGHWRVG